MRLDFSVLSASTLKPVGHQGTGGTADIRVVSGCPTGGEAAWDEVGQSGQTGLQSAIKPAEMSHQSPLANTEVGQQKPRAHEVVPRVPPVPPQRKKEQGREGAEAAIGESLWECGTGFPEAIPAKVVDGGRLTSKPCYSCIHAAKPGLGNLYCSIRDDLPPAYGLNHPLHQLPADGGASCKYRERHGND